MDVTSSAKFWGVGIVRELHIAPSLLTSKISEEENKVIKSLETNCVTG